MFIIVLKQVIILLILILLGALLTKCKVLNNNGVKNMTDLVLLLVTPCVIIKAFCREFEISALKGLIISLVATIVFHLVFILISRLLIRDKNISRQRVLQFGIIFSNCGFFSIPLLESLLGADGVFYGTAYIACFNLFIWSYGIMLMGGRESITPKKLIINPGIISVIIALVIFFFSIPVPDIILQPISFLAGLNTPLPMIIIGYHLMNSNILRSIKDLKMLLSALLKLVLLPIITILCLYFCDIRGTLPLSLVICACAPTASITTMFSSKFEQDTPLSVSLVSISTILSIITIPLIVTLAKTLLG